MVAFGLLMLDSIMEFDEDLRDLGLALWWREKRVFSYSYMLWDVTSKLYINMYNGEYI